MTNFIIGFFFGIAALLLFGYIIGIIEDRRLSKDFEIVMKPKSEINNKDKEYTLTDEQIKEIKQLWEIIKNPNVTTFELIKNENI